MLKRLPSVPRLKPAWSSRASAFLIEKDKRAATAGLNVGSCSDDTGLEAGSASPATARSHQEFSVDRIRRVAHLLHAERLLSHVHVRDDAPVVHPGE